jgi:type II secretory ATPase GspE/PulE/Tfp pilus assembly ATPase PilB-like protein
VFRQRLSRPIRHHRAARSLRPHSRNDHQPPPTSEIKRAAREEGMSFLRESGLRKVRAGITTLREINKVTFLE